MPRRRISQDQLDNFSVDTETNQLFWRDREVVTVISLPWWVQVAALAGSLSAVTMAVVAVINLLK